MKECAAVCLPARRCPREQLNSTPPLLGWWSTRWPAATLLTTCLEATRRSQPTSFVDLPLYVSGGSPLALPYCTETSSIGQPLLARYPLLRSHTEEAVLCVRSKEREAQLQAQANGRCRGGFCRQQPLGAICPRNPTRPETLYRERDRWRLAALVNISSLKWDQLR